jgi:predicted metal-dependent hydrolase
MNEKTRTIHHKQFGEIRLIKKDSIKRMSLSIEPFKGIKVTIPPFFTFEHAEKFINQKQAWISRKLVRIKNYEKALTVFRPEVEFSTREHKLKILEAPGKRGMISIRKGEVKVCFPAGVNIADQRSQKFIRIALEETWRIEARKYLPPRVRELAAKHGFQFNRISIRNNRSRWGSCSAGNSINLNLHLMRLPDELIDYVLVHELVHTRHRNHSRQFWEMLESCLPGAGGMSRKLKNFRTDIY